MTAKLALLLPTLATLATAQPQSTLSDKAAALFDDRGVREVRLYFDDPNWYNTLLAAHRTAADPYFPCRFQSGDVSIAKIGCRFKGNSSANRNGIKKPFKLDFNEYDPDAEFHGLRKLNLNNFDLQPDFLREKLLHEISGRYIAALRSVYARLYVNDNFYGLYLAVEQPDKTMMKSRWGGNEDGNIYEAEERMGTGSRPNLSWLGSSQAAYQNVYILKTNEAQNDFSRLINFLDILNNTSAADLAARIEPVADMDNWMHAMALNNLVVNLDSYLGGGAEYYIYDRTLDSRFIHIQWDNNESFGITGDGTPRLATPATTDPFWLPTQATGGPGGGGGAAANARPMLEKAWAVPEFRRLYLRALARFLREGFNPEAISARVTELAGLIREHVVADPNKAYSTAQFEANLNTAVAGIPGINQFVRERHAYLRNFLNGQAQPVDVRINELVASNPGTHKDEAGDADPWLEIHNVGPGPVTLNSFYLTDDQANPTKFALPNVTLADGAFLLVWLDNEPSEGRTHANFRAPAAGGRIFLYATAASATTPIDTVTVAALPAGQAQVRLGLHGSRWENSIEATPAAANKVTRSGGNGLLLINELMADNGTAFEDPDEPGAYEDWFEIYNPGPQPVDMAGMYITDNPDSPTKWKVGEGVVVPAGGYVVFLADNEPNQGPKHASFALNADGESLSIYNKDGTTLIDTVTFGGQRKDVSYGRTASGSWGALSSPTPGAANR